MEDKEIRLFPFVLEPSDETAGWGTESWKLADLGFVDSKVRRGLLEGSTVSEVMETYMDRIVGDDIYYAFGRQFPVQVRQLDVTSRQPLMVCPDDEIAVERYDSLGKLKIWYVAKASGNARIHLGLRQDLTATEFYNACQDGSIDGYLNEVPVRKGDCFLVKPGTMHCADAGVTIIEIAESSGLDMKVCEFVEEVFDFVNMGAETPVLLSDASSASAAADGRVKLVDRPEFVATRIDLTQPLHIQDADSGFSVYHCVSGSVSVQTPAVRENGEKYMENVLVSEGETVLVPADNSEFYLVPNAVSAVLIEVLGGPVEREEAPEPSAEDDDEGSHNKLWN